MKRKSLYPGTKSGTFHGKHDLKLLHLRSRYYQTTKRCFLDKDTWLKVMELKYGLIRAVKFFLTRLHEMVFPSCPCTRGSAAARILWVRIPHEYLLCRALILCHRLDPRCPDVLGCLRYPQRNGSRSLASPHIPGIIIPLLEGTDLG